MGMISASKTAAAKTRMTPALKKSAERVFRRLNLTASEAVALFYMQVRKRRGLPFEVLPNAATRQTMRDTDAGRNLVKCKNFNDMVRKLES